jgi:hypothetical protein
MTPAAGDPPDGLVRFTLLASAIAGRVVEVGPVVPGELPWTDGATIFVDAEADPAEQVRSVAVQASLLGGGSLDADVIKALARRPALARRYLAVEGHRVLAAPEPVLPWMVRRLADPAIAARTDSPAASLSLAAGPQAIDDPPASFGTIRPRQVRTPLEQTACSPPLQHIPRRQREEALRQVDDGEDRDHDPFALDLWSPVGGGGPIGRLLKRLLRDARSSIGGGLPGADRPTHRAGASTGAGRPVALTTASASVRDDTGVVERRDVTYPEWDVHHRRYRPDWCTVVEVGPDKDDLATWLPPDTHALRRPLARLGTELERRHRQLQGDDIDVDAAVEARIEALAGSAPDEAIYIDSVRCRRDLAVLLLLDISGSSGEPSSTGVMVHEHQRAAAAALTASLHDLGDRVALYGFRSKGRGAVHAVPVKRFAEDLEARTWRRLGGLVPAAYTRLGAAIRHGAAVLEAEGGTSRRLLVLLSDGFAYDHGYEGSYGEADARRALAETRRRGIGCLCLSIGASTDPAALRRVFGTAAHAAIPRAQQLAGVLGPLFRSALASAEMQRRVSTRKERTRERLQVERRSA